MITPFGRDIAALNYSWMFHLTIKNKFYTDENGQKGNSVAGKNPYYGGWLSKWLIFKIPAGFVYTLMFKT